MPIENTKKNKFGLCFSRKCGIWTARHWNFLWLLHLQLWRSTKWRFQLLIQSSRTSAESSFFWCCTDSTGADPALKGKLCFLPWTGNVASASYSTIFEVVRWQKAGRKIQDVVSMHFARNSCCLCSILKLYFKQAYIIQNFFLCSGYYDNLCNVVINPIPTCAAWVYIFLYFPLFSNPVHPCSM